MATLVILSPLDGKANEPNPNDFNRQPEPGWSSWKPQTEIEKADFSAGFSNTELGGYMDFENACATKAKETDSKVDYRFRLSHSLGRIGTGEAQFGCWINGRLVLTHTSTAVKTSLENVNCLRVKPTIRNGLVIRAEPTINSKQVGFVANGATVEPGSFPASIIQTDGRNWIAITSPVEGWVSDDSPTSQGNLTLCKR